MLSTYPSNRHVYLWRNRSLCLGPSSSLLPRLYGAVALHIGIYQPFQLTVDGGEPINCRCAVVPANTRHQLDFSGGIHGKLFIERDSSDYLYFLQRFPHQERALSFFEDREAIDCFRWIFEECPEKEAIATRLDLLLRYNGQLQLTFDPRVQKVIELICAEPNRNFSQEHLAAVVNLSVSRFLHLFKEHVDVPYRRFRMWKRLLNTMRNIYETDNMTQAAVEAGFSDAAHFSHCFRDTYGVNPALVFHKVSHFEVASLYSEQDRLP